MIDTIVLRLHNVKSYPKIYEQYYTPQAKKDTRTEAWIDETTGELTTINYRRAVIYHDTGRILPISFRNSFNIPSSHYSLSVYYDSSQDYLEFNFSIPKYLFSTNVQQFINLYDQSSSIMYRELMVFLNQFIKDHFLQQPLKEDIEVNRIDFCYNQFFNNKEDALFYLDEQKRLKARKSRDGANKSPGYGTTLWYKTAYYVFKIYHKGTEFRKHDYKKLVKNNPKGLNLQWFLDIADCINRYECSFNKRFLKYLINFYFFDSKQSLSDKYQHHKLNDVAQALIKFQVKDIRSDRNQSLYDYFKSRQKSLRLVSAWDFSNDVELLVYSNEITFDETIFSIMFDTFFKMVQNYQLNQMLSLGEINRRIDEQKEFNKIKNKLRRKDDQQFASNKFRMLSCALLAQYMNIDDLKQFLPRSTFFDLKRDLKKIGITAKDSSLNMPTPRTDYFDYKLYFKNLH